MKATTCRVCGAPRDMSIEYALCTEHYRVYCHNRPFQHGPGRRGRALWKVYNDLGLKVGQVKARAS